MRRALSAWLLVFAVTACMPPPKPEPYTQSYDMWLGRSVDARDGIDKDEASVIAYAFYASGVSDCGSPLEPQSADDGWVSSTLTDSGKPGKPIYIDIKTGEVSCGDAILSLDELRKFKREPD
jgi:hypothetical protein